MDKKFIRKEPPNVVSTSIVSNPFEDIELPEGIEEKLLVKTIGNTLIDTLASLTGTDKLFNFFNSYKEKLDNARLLILLDRFKKKYEDTEQFKHVFRHLISTPSGMNLFQKILRILNANMVDMSYAEVLANVLKNISDSDLESLFEEHNYILSQIEKLTPQALLLLSDHRNWPGITFSSSTTSGVTSGSGWDVSFADLYSRRKGIDNDRMKARIIHSINELKNTNLVELGRGSLPLTFVGEEISKYLQS